jgi:hypothetical protein
VRITWNTITSAVDLVVTGPDNKPHISSVVSGQGTSQGPRTFELATAKRGTYKIEVKLGTAMPETTPETCVFVEILRSGDKKPLGKPQTVILRRQGERVLVSKVDFAD